MTAGRCGQGTPMENDRPKKCQTWHIFKYITVIANIMMRYILHNLCYVLSMSSPCSEEGRVLSQLVFLVSDK